jgi:hypothetical protein
VRQSPHSAGILSLHETLGALLELLVQKYTVILGLLFWVLDGCHLGKMINILTNELSRRLIEQMSKQFYKALPKEIVTRRRTETHFKTLFLREYGLSGCSFP